MIEIIKENHLAKPVLKWVGGKTQLLKQFEYLYPQQLTEGKIDKYFELFLGGGAVFCHVIQKYPLKQVFLNDINQDLILAYRVIQQKHQKLIDSLAALQQKYYLANIEKRKQIFYQIRQDYNSQRINFNYKNLSSESIVRTSWFIFLNKTCFNGLYRTNKKGNFNVPVGKYKNPKICDRQNIIKLAHLLENVTLISDNYRAFTNIIDRQSFVYLDPPYRPINITSNFTAYAKSGFNDEDQIALSQYYRYLHKNCGAKIMLSNSNPHNTDLNDNFFHQLYREYNIHQVSANRMVNSNSSKRGKISELVITNY